MYVYKCRYTDFFNNEREEEFRFNLTESEVLNKELTTQGGLQNLLERMTQKQDVPSLAKFFREFLEISYGEISPDGRNFNKSPDIWNNFESSNAYNELYMKLLSDDEFAVDFIAGVIPTTGSAKEAPNNQNLIAIENAKAKVQAKIAERNN